LIQGDTNIVKHWEGLKAQEIVPYVSVLTLGEISPLSDTRQHKKESFQVWGGFYRRNNRNNTTGKKVAQKVLSGVMSNLPILKTILLPAWNPIRLNLSGCLSIHI